MSLLCRLGLLAVFVLCLAPSTLWADRAQARALVAEGEVFAKEGRFEKALLRFEQAIASDPDYHPGFELAIPLWIRLDKGDTARRELESLTLRCEDCVFAWYALGAIYRKAQRFDLAVLAYDAYLSKRPSDPDAYFGLSMALGALEDKRTTKALRRYLELEKRPSRRPFKEQAEKLLAELSPESRTIEVPPVAPDNVLTLIQEGQYLSAESLLNRWTVQGALAMRLRADIAKGRGRWFQQAVYLGLAWLWER